MLEHGKKTLALIQKCPCGLCESRREQQRETRRRSYHRCEKPDRKDYRKAYYSDNKEYYKTYYEENRGRYLEHFKASYQDDKEGSRLKKQKRRALRVSQLGKWPLGEKQHLLLLHKEQKGLCYYCGKSYEDGRHIEHKIPLSRGGLHDHRNVVLSCVGCNLEKRDKTETEYREFLDSKISA